MTLLLTAHSPRLAHHLAVHNSKVSPPLEKEKEKRKQRVTKEKRKHRVTKQKVITTLTHPLVLLMFSHAFNRAYFKLYIFSVIANGRNSPPLPLVTCSYILHFLSLPSVAKLLSINQIKLSIKKTTTYV